MTFDDAAEALSSAEYVFARTMPHAPHWYTVKHTWADQERFEASVRAIRDFGYSEKYGKATYVKLDVNGFKYWTMGAAPRSTTLINRDVIQRDAVYDAIANTYASLWSTPDAVNEDRRLFERLAYRDGSVLDVGCGDGLFLRNAAPHAYLGVDPSREMLALLRRQHPGHATRLSTFEAFWTRDRYDLIVALYGVASYIKPAALERIPAMLTKRGRFFLMFFKPGHVPVTHTATNISPEMFDGAASLPVTPQPWGDYLIAEGGRG